MIAMADTEIWKPIYGYTGFYEVSNLGNVRNSRTGRVLKLHSNLSAYQREHCPRNSKDYYFAQLCKGGVRKNFYVHYLVCRNFIGPRPKNHDIEHKDGDSANNALSNLMYRNQYGNRAHHAIDCPCPWCAEAGCDDDGGDELTIEDVFAPTDSEVPF